MGPTGQGPESLAGQLIGGYRLVRLIGMGATGAVFLGQRETSDGMPARMPERAAIKVLILPWQLTPKERDEFRLRFAREARVLQRLQHPHILAVLDSGEDSATGLSYMVLPYMAGGTLSTQLADGHGLMPLDDAAHIIAQVADALDYAHTQGLVHRDVKPANILLDEDGQAYLADFGIVRLLEQSRSQMTSSGRIMGTPEYMAPEQLGGSRVGPVADIYSLGVVLFQLVVGRVPFTATTLMELLRLQLEAPPPPPRLLRPELPEPAEAAILRALAKQPSDRFASASALARAFTAGLDGRWTEGLAPRPAGGSAPGDATYQGFGVPPTLVAPVPLVRQGIAPRTAVAGALAMLLIVSALAVLLTGLNGHNGGSSPLRTGEITVTPSATSGSTPAPTSPSTSSISTPTSPAAPPATSTLIPTPTPTATPVPQTSVNWAFGPGPQSMCSTDQPPYSVSGILTNLGQPNAVSTSWTARAYDYNNGAGNPTPTGPDPAFNITPASGTLQPNASVTITATRPSPVPPGNLFYLQFYAAQAENQVTDFGFQC
jgi:eukaryotic-like serine/threonine-protein kinase